VRFHDLEEEIDRVHDQPEGRVNLGEVREHPVPKAERGKDPILGLGGGEVAQGYPALACGRDFQTADEDAFEVLVGEVDGLDLPGVPAEIVEGFADVLGPLVRRVEQDRYVADPG